MQETGVQKLGRHLKLLRVDRKLTLGGVESLSEDYGDRINKTYLFRVESGKTTPTLSRLHVLSRIYRVRLTSLVDILESASVKPKPQYDLGRPLADFTFEDLRTKGIDAERAGDFARSVMLFRAARDRAMLDPPSADRHTQVATARHDLAIALRNAGDWHGARNEAEDLFEDWKLSTELRDKLRLNLAIIYRRIGQPVLAAMLLEGLIERKDSLAPEILAFAHQEMGSQLVKSNPKRAIVHYKNALRLQRRGKNHLDVCGLLINIGVAHLNAREYLRSSETLTSALELGRRHQFCFPMAAAKSNIGKNLFLQGKLREARIALREAVTDARRGEYKQLLLQCYYYLWRIACSEGDAAAARATEASLKFYASRVDEPSEELETYRKERT